IPTTTTKRRSARAATPAGPRPRTSWVATRPRPRPPRAPSTPCSTDQRAALELDRRGPPSDTARSSPHRHTAASRPGDATTRAARAAPAVKVKGASLIAVASTTPPVEMAEGLAAGVGVGKVAALDLHFEPQGLVERKLLGARKHV